MKVKIQIANLLFLTPKVELIALHGFCLGQVERRVSPCIEIAYARASTLVACP